MSNIEIVCRSFITDFQGRILVVRKTGSDFWSLPGGKLDAEDVSMQKCLVRELREELGVETEIGAIRFVQELHKNNTRYVELIWNAMIIENQMHEDISKISNGELEAAKWIPKNELQNIDVRPDFLKNLV